MTTSFEQPETPTPASASPPAATAEVSAPVLASKTRDPAIRFIFFTVFLDVLGLGIIIPIAPKLIQQFETGPNVSLVTATALAATDVGILAAIYSLMQFVFSPILGSLSDTFGRRPVILISLLGSGIDYIATAFAPTLSILYFTRAINGISGANITAAMAYIADVSPPEKRAGNFGVIGAAFGLGFIFGPLMGGWLGSFSSLGEYAIRLPFFVAAGLCLINALYGYFVLPESLKPENRRAFTWKSTNPANAFTVLGKYPIVLGLATSLFLLFIAEYSLRSTWVLFTGYRFTWTSREVGISLAIVGVCAAIVQGGLSRKIIPLLGERKSVLFGLLVVILGYTAYGLATHGWMFYVIIACTSIGGIGGPAVQGLISRSVAANEQGTIQGALASLQSLAGIVGPLIGTNLFSYFIGEHAPAHLPGIAFFLGAFLAAIALTNTLLVLMKARRLQLATA